MSRHARRAVVVCWSIAILALAGRSGSASPVPASFPASDVARIDAIANAAVARGTPGIVVAIDDPVRGHFVKAYGRSSVDGAAFDPAMSYRIASVTKTFTARAVLGLVASGRVALDDPLSKYVGDMPNGNRATVADLLAMRAGIYSYTNDPAFAAAYDDSNAPSDDGPAGVADALEQAQTESATIVRARPV